MGIPMQSDVTLLLLKSNSKEGPGGKKGERTGRRMTCLYVSGGNALAGISVQADALLMNVHLYGW